MNHINNKTRILTLIREAEEQFAGTGKEFTDIEDYVAEYLLANGVIVPPCKVGQIVYLFYPVRKGIYEAVVDEISLTQKSNFIVTRDLYFNRRQAVFFEQIGKTVFLSREEAEAALKGSDDEQN